MEIRRFRPGDEAALSALIRRTLHEVNRPDCPVAETEWLYAHYTPAAVAENAAAGHSYVVTLEGIPVGTGTILPAPRGESEIAAAFLLPEAMGRGYGAALFDTLESDALFTAAPRVWLTSSFTAMGFYEKRGYAYSYGYRGFNAEGLLEMEKRPLCPAVCRAADEPLAARLRGEAGERLARCLRAGGWGYAALREERVLGVAAVRPETPDASGALPGGAVLEYLAVEPAFRRQGVATRLLTHVERRAVREGFVQLRALCAAPDAAALLGRLHYTLCPDGAGAVHAARLLPRP